MICNEPIYAKRPRTLKDESSSSDDDDFDSIQTPFLLLKNNSDNNSLSTQNSLSTLSDDSPQSSQYSGLTTDELIKLLETNIPTVEYPFLAPKK